MRYQEQRSQKMNIVLGCVNGDSSGLIHLVIERELMKQGSI